MVESQRGVKREGHPHAVSHWLKLADYSLAVLAHRERGLDLGREGGRGEERGGGDIQ